MLRALRVAAALSAAGVCGAGCGRGAPDGAAGAEALAARFEVAGCAAVVRAAGAAGAVCEVAPAARALRVWVGVEDAAIGATWDGAPIGVSASAAAGGQLATIEISAERAGRAAAAGPARVEVIATKGGARATWALAVAPAATDARLDAVRALRKEGRLEDARAAMPDPAALPEALRGRAIGLAARLALAAGRVDEAAEGLRRSMAAHRREGRASDEVLDGMALAHTLVTYGRRYAEARAVLDGLSAALVIWDEGRAQVGYYRALVAVDLGDVRSALRDLAEAERDAARLGLGEAHRSARQVAAQLLLSLGRADEALATLEALERELPADAGACERADVGTNVGWARLMRAEAQGEPGTAAERADRARRLEATVSLYREGCPRPADIQNGLVNLALAAALDGDPAAAARHAAAARAVQAQATPTGAVAAWLLDVEARVALAQDRAREALARYDELAARARAASAPEALWRASVGRGRALERLARMEDAIAAYREAEDVLARQTLLIPLAEGRAGFLGDREQSARRLAGALIRARRPAEALDAARVARARAVASAQRPDRVAGLGPAARARWEAAIGRYLRERDALDAEAEGDWKVAADALPALRVARRAREEALRAALDEAFAVLAETPPAPSGLGPPRDGELVLAFLRAADSDGFHGFAAEPGAVVTRALPPVSPDAPPEALAQALLEPFSADIGRARRVRVLAGGALQGVDFHALPFRGAPLVAHAPVVYGLDLPAAGAAPRAPAERPAALVVADARDNLPQARREAARVRGALEGAWDAGVLLGDAARKPDVLRRLPEVALFHFAGHGVFAGRSGWESTLELADAGRLTVGDILTLPAAPARVILSGCETGRSAAAGHVVDVSLAHAFLTAGAETVIATARPVKDELAAAIADALYARAADPQWDVVESFRAAELDVLRRLPAADWAAYRVVTR